MLARTVGQGKVSGQGGSGTGNGGTSRKKTMIEDNLKNKNKQTNEKQGHGKLATARQVPLQELWLASKRGQTRKLPLS